MPIYYLMGESDAQPEQFTSTFFIRTRTGRGTLLTGPEGYTAAVQDGHFQVIADSNSVTLAADGALAKALNASRVHAVERVSVQVPEDLLLSGVTPVDDYRVGVEALMATRTIP